MLLVAVIDASENLTGHVIEDRADLREIGMGRVGRRGSVGQGRGRRRESVCVVLRCQSAQRRIGLDDVDDIEMAGAERLFCSSHAAECSSAIDRGVCRRDRGIDVGQDRLNMAERGAGVLSRVHFSQQTILHRGEIVRITGGAASSLAAFLDHVLPQSALKRASGIIER